MSDEPKQEGTESQQQQSQTPEVKKEEAPTTTSEAQPSSPVEEKSTVQSSEEEKPKKANPKRKNSKPRSRSNSLNRGATAKEWKPKGDAKVNSTINANAPPFVSQHHQQQANAAREVAQESKGEQQQEGASEPQTPQHHLQTPWTFWYSRKNKKGKGHGGAAPVAAAAGEQTEAKEAKEGGNEEKEREKEKEPKPAKGKKKKGQQTENPPRDVPTPLVTVHTVEEFWANYCYLQKPSALPKESNYHFFRNKLEPMWETFPKGGCYIVRVKKQNGKLDQMWEELLFASIGELFEDPNVVGVVVSIRSKEDALSVWTRTSQKNPRTKVSEKLKEILELDKSTLVGYKSNASSIRDKSTYKNTKKIILAS